MKNDKISIGFHFDPLTAIQSNPPIRIIFEVLDVRVKHN